MANSKANGLPRVRDHSKPRKGPVPRVRDHSKPRKGPLPRAKKR